jgi:cytochrome P450
MRLYPVAPFVVRKLTQDILVPNADRKSNEAIRLPRSAIACLWIYGLHHHPDYWSQPEDFCPDRWLHSSNRDPGISHGAYIPFAVGPPNCLGQPLAHWILRTLLARVVQSYDVQDARVLATSSCEDPPREWRHDMQAGFTVLPRGGVHLIASSRTSKCG